MTQLERIKHLDLKHFDWHPIRWLREHLGGTKESLDPFPLHSPDLDVVEGGSTFMVRANVPGLGAEDLDVSVCGNRLVVRGQAARDREEKGEDFFYTEHTFGGFVRAIVLPDSVDATAVGARLDRGVLTIEVPYLPGKAPRAIPIER